MSKPTHQQPSPYLWGMCDAKAGLSIDENPYDGGSDEYNQWVSGYVSFSIHGDKDPGFSRG